MRSTQSHRRVGPLAVALGAVLLLAACTDDGNGSDVRSPAPTGSLTPASSASPTPQGGVIGVDGATARLQFPPARP